MSGSELWPAGVQCAVVLSFDLDAETLWLSRNPRSADSPACLAQGAYGPKVGVPRLLEMLRRQEVRSTFFIPGWVVERYPETARAIAAAGHEIGYHGYLHERPESAERERELIDKVKVIMSRVLGTTPVGHRSPLWECLPGLVDVLCASGFEYASNLMDADLPYLHAATDGSGLVELPTSWLYEDAAHFFFTLQEPARRPIATTDTVMNIWTAEFDGLYDEGGILVLTMHPQIMGRVSRVRMLDQFITYVKSRPGTWIAPGIDVARAVRPKLRAIPPYPAGGHPTPSPAALPRSSHAGSNTP